MKQPQRRALWAIVTALALTEAPACGGSDKGEGSDTPAGPIIDDTVGIVDDANDLVDDAIAGPAPTAPDPNESASKIAADIDEDCKERCDKIFALPCPPEGETVENCREACPRQYTDPAGFCLHETRDLTDCQARSPHSCVQIDAQRNLWRQEQPCTDRDAALRACLDHIECKIYCAKSIELSCNNGAFDACFDTCRAREEAVGSGWGQVAVCRGRDFEEGTLTCSNGELLGGGQFCDRSVLRAAEDIIDDEPDKLCEGWCFAATQLQCGGAACAATCATALEDAQCGDAFRAYATCLIEREELVCSEGQPTIRTFSASCSTLGDTYDACKNQQ